MPALAQPPILPEQKKDNQTPPVKYIFINCAEIQYVPGPVFS